jgi:hypothetical protein
MSYKSNLGQIRNLIDQALKRWKFICQIAIIYGGEGGLLGTLEIQKRARIVSAARGRGREVILPYLVYCDLLELKTTMEIYKREEVQRSLKKGRKEIGEGRTKSFRKAHVAIKWLKR